jgi:hypothetical protein
VRRDFAPAGGSLSFVASNESNQSKDAFHFAVPLRLLPSATCHPRQHRTTAHLFNVPHHSLAAHRLDDASGGCAPWRRGEARRGWEVAKQRPYCSWAPWEASRSAGVWGRVRSALRQLTSRGLSERSGRRPRSEFGARPQRPSTAEQSALRPTASVGSPFFGDFLWRSKERYCPVGGTSRRGLTPVNNPHAKAV